MTDVAATGGITAKTRWLLESLHRAGPGPYAPSDAARLWGMDAAHARRRLAMLADRGWLIRPTRGLYVPVPLDASRSGEWAEDPWLIAVKLFPGGYLGGWTACEHWGLTDQVFRSVYVYTPRRLSRTLDRSDAPITVKFTQMDRIFGLVKVWRRSVRVSVSDPSRTIVDLLDDPAAGGGIRQVAEMVDEYFRSAHRDDQKLEEYVVRAGNRTVYKRLGYLLEELGIDATALSAACAERKSAGISLLDPALGPHGPTITRWRLRINADLE